MSNLPKHLKSEVGKARVAGGGVYINHGTYVFMVDAWKYVKVVDECIIVELLVGQAREKSDPKLPEPTNKPGTTCSEVANFDGAGKQSAGANARAVAEAMFGPEHCAGKSDDDISELLDAQLGPDQPCRGMLVGCDTYPKEIRSNKGNYITGRNWKHVAKPGIGLNSPDMAKARLAAYAVSPDECVRLIAEQSKAAGVSLPAVAAAPPATTAAPPDAPAIPTAPTAPPITVVDPFAGWTVHPKDPTYYFRGQEVKSKADLLAAAGK